MMLKLSLAASSLLAAFYGLYLVNGVLTSDRIGIQAAAMGVGVALFSLSVISAVLATQLREQPTVEEGGGAGR